mgnify:CR=1 FL=1
MLATLYEVGVKCLLSCLVRSGFHEKTDARRRENLKFEVFGILRQRNVLTWALGSLSKPRRRRQRERQKTKGLMSKTIAVHVRYKSLYISLPSSAKQQREMIEFCVVYGTWTTTANFSYFHLELNAANRYLA